MLERYLHAIECWLPEEERRDIISEISEDLTSQIEEQESSLGRKLTDGEVEALLKRRGRPALVANSYRPQKSLIGPIWFPAYQKVLKTVGLYYVLPWLIVSLAVHRFQHEGSGWGPSFLAAATGALRVAFVSAAAITVIFVLLEWAEARTHFLDNWNPRRLPPVRNPYRIPLSASVSELAINLAFILFWTVRMSSPVLFDDPGFKLVLSPLWTWFFWGFLAIAACNVALAVASVRNSWWTPIRAACRIAVDLSGGVLFCWVLKANLVATLYVASIDPARTHALGNAIRICEYCLFPVAVIISTVVVVVDVVRIVRVGRNQGFAVAGCLPALMLLLALTAASGSQGHPLRPAVASSLRSLSHP
jgi:hypothetical protein